MKKDIKPRAFVAPTPTVVAAAYDSDGKVDVCTLAFVMMSSHKPPCATIAINASLRRKTLGSILERGAFTINYPGANHIEQTDYFGVESGYNADKLANANMTATQAKTVDAPVIDQMPLCLECKVVHTVTVGSHTQITGEICNIQADTSITNEEGKVNIAALNPLIYDEESLTYHTVGDKAGDAFKMGAALRSRLKS